MFQEYNFEMYKDDNQHISEQRQQPEVNSPHLLTVDHPLVALLLGLGFNSGNVGAGPGFGDSVSANDRLLETESP